MNSFSPEQEGHNCGEGMLERLDLALCRGNCTRPVAVSNMRNYCQEQILHDGIGNEFNQQQDSIVRTRIRPWCDTP